MPSRTCSVCGAEMERQGATFLCPVNHDAIPELAQPAATEDVEQPGTTEEEVEEREEVAEETAAIEKRAGRSSERLGEPQV